MTDEPEVVWTQHESNEDDYHLPPDHTLTPEARDFLMKRWREVNG